MDRTDVAACWEGNADTWTRLVREGHDIYRDVLNTPAFLDMLPDVSGQRGLDIGCGEGTNTRKLAEAGAQITAIDFAPTFIGHAKATEAEDPRGIDYSVADAGALPFDDASFDFAASFMCLMDIPDQAQALAEAARVVKPGGFFQFSILHPCFAPPHRKPLREAGGHVRAIEVGRYFDTDPYVEKWCFSSIPAAEREGLEPFTVPSFHRPLSSWVDIILAAGLHIEAMGEPGATPEQAAAHPTVADTLTAPIFLIIRARKPRSASL